MKRFMGLLLTIALLLALNAPALARDVLSEGQYTVDANLEVPENAVELGAFTVTIPPESIGLQYGEVEKELYYAIDVDFEKYPVCRKVTMEITSDFYGEWSYTDEETGEERTDWGCFLVNEQEEDEICYDLYADNGGRRLAPAPHNWGEHETPLFGDYYRHVNTVANFEGEDSYKDGFVLMHIRYDGNPNAKPGHYYSALTYNIGTGWAYDKNWLEEKGYEYIVAEGYEDRVASDWDDPTAAFDPNGWPWEERVTGFREKT